MYTQEAVYRYLNRKLREEDREKLKPFFPYLGILLTALTKLPSVGQCTVYRGVKGHDLRDANETGDTVTWYNFSSCTTDGDVLKTPMFLGPSGPRTLFAVTCRNGRDIMRYSSFKNEKEVLLLAGTTFKVDNSMQVPGSDGLVIINLTEIDLPAGVKFIS